mmetsp:Transcript_24514/g.64704  ORF Transcript_24514/g.64704 Transcript_24514/m.64704 type:complete len:109 (+) Transcript_24514:2-328(+)
MNSVALAFVLDIGKMIYACVLPRGTQQSVTLHCIALPGKREGVRSVETCSIQHRKGRTNAALRSIFLSYGFMLGAPALYTSFQQVLPSYQWDVAGPCERYFKEMRRSV